MILDVPPIATWWRAPTGASPPPKISAQDAPALLVGAAHGSGLRLRAALCFRLAAYLDNDHWLRLSCCSTGWRDLVTLRAQMGFVHEAARPWRSRGGDHFSGWERLGLAVGGSSKWEALRARLLVPPPRARQGLRCRADEITLPHFYRHHETLPGMPVIFTDLATSWPCFSCPTRRWTMENMLRRFSTDWCRFDDLHGEEMPLRSYWAYTLVTQDDSPLAIYDSQFGEPEEEDENEEEDNKDDEADDNTNNNKNQLAGEYTVPAYFRDDMFSIVCSTDIDSVPASPGASDNDNRPPFRWVLIGPQRSGTGLHIDPLMTSAWVTLLHGEKRWFMFPPDVSHARVGFHEHGSAKMEAVEWFLRFTGTEAAEGVDGCIEILQRAGETVFVPAGWLHIVVNLTTTLSITHNYASPHSGKAGIQAIWEEIATIEPEFARRWFQKLVCLISGEEGEAGVCPGWVQANDVERHVRERHAELRARERIDWDL